MSICNTIGVVTVLLCMAGLDYVSHDDILPYTSTSQDPFQHELFDQFLTLESKDDGMLFCMDMLSLHVSEFHFFVLCVYVWKFVYMCRYLHMHIRTYVNL